MLVILMKKYLFPVLSSLAIGIFMAVFIIKQYDNNLDVTVSLKAEKLYYVQKGAYSNLENMKNNMKDFENYIYDVSDNMYYTYIGISLSKDNAVKIQNYYKENGYETLIKEKITDNSDFVNILKKYDELLSGVKEGDSIKTICNQVLSKYEDAVNGKFKN